MSTVARTRERAWTRRAAVAAAVATGAVACHVAAGAVGSPHAPLPLVAFGAYEHVVRPMSDLWVMLLMSGALIVFLRLSTDAGGRARALAFDAVVLLLMAAVLNLGEERLRGAVRDYFWIAPTGSGWGAAFNVADASMVAGVAVLLRSCAASIAEWRRAGR
jgi:hypothetical protein